MTPAVSASRFRSFSLVVIGATLVVILWGAYVRASGSGAGCGNHWPTCNGEVIPRAPTMKTIVEFTHRITSGVAFLLVLVQYIWARRVFAKTQGARKAAAASLFFMVTEALVGGGLVLFEMVAGNKSIARAWWMAGHLLNTFALVATLTLTWWLAKPRNRMALPRSLFAPGLTVALFAVALVALSGAIAALGDTLFPAASLSAGLEADVSATAHAFVRLRLWHPFLAVAVGAFVLLLVSRMLAKPGFEAMRGNATLVAALVVAQVMAGLINLLLLAPIAMQVVHLLMADVLWIALVVLRARFSREAIQTADVTHPRADPHAASVA